MKLSSVMFFAVFAAFCASIAQPYAIETAKPSCEYAAKAFQPTGTLNLDPVYITGNVIEVPTVEIVVYR